MGNSDRDRASIARLEASVKEERRLKQKLQDELTLLTQQNEKLTEENERLRRSEEELEAFRGELVNIRLEINEKLQDAESEAASARLRSEGLNSISQDVRACVNNLVILARQLATDEDNDSNERSAYVSGLVESVDDLKSVISDLLETTETISLNGKPLGTAPGGIEDDRDVIEPGDRVLIVITEDERLARNILDQGHERGFEIVVSSLAASAPRLANEIEPQAIVLDYGLSERGEASILKTLRKDPGTRHIPVYVYAARESAFEALRRGAKGILWKPGDRKAISDALDSLEDFLERDKKRILVVCEDGEAGKAITEAVADDDVEIEMAASGDEALQLMRETRFDCAVVDPNLPDMSGLGFVLRTGAPETVPIPCVVHTGKKYSAAQAEKLIDLSRKRILTRSDSLLSLIDHTSSFLHRTEWRTQRLRTKVVEATEGNLSGAKVLMVDDDPRNLFAMSALLEEQGAEVHQADSGHKALAMLKSETRPDIVLMDIMMPEMDGFETMRRIRSDSHFFTIPIIALTAKALKGDREACIVAGASDYMSKPIDTDKLLALMRAWLH